ncbi:trigger factor [Lederbergia lenta]|uniref:Trigger factor n=1 Tax=Lederbergia lenta TaxID=1467 RepID=A0A2X4VUN5_LEDLE|nr:trigger factor [Lederbergia lenta]MCM3111251.1 trigger factor [Lederbergia lenta]MEC2325361.1 trigger factor [Lederbergia lenta]SQI55776.1 trigger factor [Lederbergia lenta]
MSAKWEKQEGNKGVLTVEVDAEKVNAGLDEAFKKVSKQVNIPGFRKGKIPRGMFEKRFGVESLYQDALDVLLPEAYSNAIDEAGIEPIDRPDIDIEQMEKGKELIFKATVLVKPEVKLGEYKGLEAEKLDAEVTEEDVAEELKTLQERQAELVVKDGGTAEDGDTVVIDFEGFVDGEAFEGGKSENYSLEIGSGSFIPGFEEQVIGLETGAEKEIEVSFPEEYHAAELAGKPAIFKVKVHEIKTKELPELDDEFAKDVDEEAETLEELKNSIKERLSESKKNEAEQKLRDSLVDQATANSEIDLPEIMVETEVDRMMQEFEQRLQMQGMNLELYFQFSGQEEDALRAQMKVDGEQRVRTNLTLEAIAKTENLEADDEDVSKEVDKMAKMYNMPVEEIQNALGGNLDNLKADLKVQKAVEFLVENSKTKA